MFPSKYPLAFEDVVQLRDGWVVKKFFSGLGQTESELHEDSGQSSIYTQSFCFVWIKSTKPGGEER